MGIMIHLNLSTVTDFIRSLPSLCSFLLEYSLCINHLIVCQNGKNKSTRKLTTNHSKHYCIHAFQVRSVSLSGFITYFSAVLDHLPLISNGLRLPGDENIILRIHVTSINVTTWHHLHINRKGQKVTYTFVLNIILIKRKLMKNFILCSVDIVSEEF